MSSFSLRHCKASEQKENMADNLLLLHNCLFYLLFDDRTHSTVIMKWLSKCSTSVIVHLVIRKLTVCDDSMQLIYQVLLLCCVFMYVLILSSMLRVVTVVYCKKKSNE
jgi:hypothetical protein